MNQNKTWQQWAIKNSLCIYSVYSNDRYKNVVKVEILASLLKQMTKSVMFVLDVWKLMQNISLFGFLMSAETHVSLNVVVLLFNIQHHLGQIKRLEQRWTRPYLYITHPYTPCGARCG